MKLLSLCMACLVLAGCGSVAYRRGGAATDFETARRLCAHSEAFTPCLQARGWHIAATPAPAAPTSGTAASGGTASATAAASAGPPTAPDKRVVVSWWKWGGTTQMLAAARAACGSGPDPVVSAAATRCLEAKGWHPVGS